MNPTQASDGATPRRIERENERAKADIASAIGEVFSDASDDGYRVGWHDALDFEHGYLDATEEIFDSLVDSGSYDAALVAGIEALQCVERLEVDDSFGFLDAVITGTIELFKRLAKVRDDAFTERLVDTIAAFLETPPGRDSARDTFELQETDIAQFLFGHFGRRRAHARRLETLARGRVEEARCPLRRARARGERAQGHQSRQADKRGRKATVVTRGPDETSSVRNGISRV